MMLRTAPSTHASFVRGTRVGCSRWFRCWVAAAAVLSLANNNNILLVTALSSSPWKTGYWQLTVNLGREPTTTLPEVWGQSGARLVFPVALGAGANPLGSAEDAYWQGHTANHLQVLTDISNTATYITERGQQRVPLVEWGGWRLTTTRRNAKQGEASLLRFWLDLQGGDDNNKNTIVAQKRDTTLCAGDRLYFSAHCWRESQYEAGVRRMRPIQAAYEQAKDAVTQQLSHDDGDRRLDGTNALDTLAAYRDMATLTMDRDQKRRAWKEAQEYLPLLSSALSQRSKNHNDIPMGHWPGSTERLVVQPREILVRRRGGGSGGIFGSGILAQDEFHVVGKWTIKPLEMEDEEDDDDEYEYYYEDDDEDDEEEEDFDVDDDEAEEEYKQSSRETERRRTTEES